MIQLTTISPCLLNLQVKELICNHIQPYKAGYAKSSEEELNMLPIQMPLSATYGIQQKQLIVDSRTHKLQIKLHVVRQDIIFSDF